jgi:trehalose synthase
VTDVSESDPAVDLAEARPEPGIGLHRPSEITYDEQRYVARPRRLRPRARRSTSGAARGATEATAKPDAADPAYVQWLVDQSMLSDAKQLAIQLSGQGSMWQNPFAHPNPAAAVERAPVWFTAYPLSFMAREGESFLAALADPALWRAFAEIGISALHTGPVKLAGGIDGWRHTPSVDGHFDRTSMQIDPVFGTEEEFRRLCAVAAEFDGTIIDDIVPGHTGKGADFRLAEMGYADYPGIYHMVAIDPADWALLPEVPAGADSVNLDADAEALLANAGYIIGELQRVIFFEPGVKETNWSVTRPVLGVDGIERRWVYLHYFKAGQPSINWLDPSFAGVRLVIGDALHALADLGSGALRLDANGFLGVERSAEGEPAWSEGHPLSEAANHMVASMIRKMGGFSFQELNLGIDDIKTMGDSGADLSYDFINRPAYHHALVTGDTEFLRLTLNTALRLGINPGSLVHALQNHDELTHELVHFSATHQDERRAHARRHRPDFSCPSPVGHVQRVAARRVRPLGLGPVRDAHARRGGGAGPDRARRHPVDQPRGARSPRDRRGTGARQPRAATGAESLRPSPPAAEGSDVVRKSPAPHPRHPPAVRDRDQPPG